MESTNDIKIISMLGEVNNKINDIVVLLENMQERMNKNFCILAEAQGTTNDKLNEIGEDIKNIRFRTEVLEAGVGLNASKILELSEKGV